MNSSQKSWKYWTILASPVAVIAIGYLVAVFGGRQYGAWAWLPVTIVYWACLAGLIAWGAGREGVKRWLQPSQGKWYWRPWPLITGILYFTVIFIPNFSLLDSAWLVIGTLVIALINPLLEEGYWRGLLMDTPKRWPGWLVILYSAFWFGASHPLVLGINVPALAGVPGFIGTFISGALFSLVYWKTRSLRWPIAGHLLADLAGLPILIFLNLAVMPM